MNVCTNVSQLDVLAVVTSPPPATSIHSLIASKCTLGYYRDISEDFRR